MSRTVDAYVGLGSNLDGPREQIERALEALERLPLTGRVQASRLYVSAPVGPVDQPDFVNAVARLETRLSPLALLDQLQALEQRHRRVRRRRWGPRTLDLDLLLYGDRVIDTPRLRVPHPELAARAFVVVPLAELAPELQLPDGRRLAALREALPLDDGLQVLPNNPRDE
ncbi:2-amino-4-hydroxy-6-hydroxymethyldihydropteridine diphosphokinase [Halomonas campisalis]|uniref:2-amino-4-hydroxy-6-hydroxymethyldihydropteridine pyrophosphokinase n=1 Tax=Billgrantia campisalis TaxID=74661 RepID=A0ABS9PEK7_9GAMM|nr:2-amino-4-hydroxy-6-hydroxymethyldihydropteridine diphosphokinase [Halomonas campisalis]MCG6659550.1 2-amino-4-hydroxy-6-hydroxymethyldihydropteridine diphosphokinase [Halomonas campisalis]MDR5864411.1 2-amino-4-hydroxy-6-hydroxymethyldihydropteridine diphosphokinase [Halomonas campisalis]